MKLSEIYDIEARHYIGGSKELNAEYNPSFYLENIKDAKEFPDNPGFICNVVKHPDRIWLFALEKDTYKLVGALSLDEETSFPIDRKSFNVDSITTHEDYRRRGIAQSLYKNALRKPPNGLGITLMTGYSQTPDGQRAWVMLGKDPSITITGFFAIHDAIMQPEYYSHLNSLYDMERLLDELFGKIGAFEVARSGSYIIYGFPIKFLHSRAAGEVETELLKLYYENKIHHGITIKSGMFAQHDD